MKKQLMASLLAFFLAALSCPAQEVPIKPQRWEVGVDAISLFNKNHYPAYSIFMARKLGENGFALRSRIGVEGSSFEDLLVVLPNSPFTRPNKNQKRNFFGSLGLQHNLWFKGNLSYFYTGADIGIKIDQESVQKLDYLDNFNDYYFENKRTFTDYMVSPFFGYSHHLKKNFSLRIEMAANLTITNFKLRGNGWYLPRFDQSTPFIPPIIENRNTYEIGDHRTIDYRFNPINQIIISYHF
ncbi:MAG TPA: hypothetical protein VK921_11535 [Anditalea sp.]|nr:hypothetical protein [Anditalea sp.]